MNYKKKILNAAMPILAFVVLFILLFIEHSGIPLKTGKTNHTFTILKDSSFSEAVTKEVDTILLYDSTDESSNLFCKEMIFILHSMGVKPAVCDVSSEKIPDFSPYKKCVLALDDLDCFGDDILTFCSWVKNGGCVMNVYSFDIKAANFSILAPKLGISYYNEFINVDGMKIKDDFMLGTSNRDFPYDESTLTALNVNLYDDCQVYITTINKNIPLLWKSTYGKGCFIVMNQVLSGKVNRGILSAAYASLGEGCVYPVINASAFYLDDFPSPVPEGNSTYISRDYGLDIESFYSNIWWPDVMQWEKNFGIVYTGMIIENYSDTVSGEFQRNTNRERFTFFGNMLLNNGGELGYHGYNHMPLCLEGFDYQGMYDSYKLWKSTNDMSAALTELNDFANNLFPGQEFQVYVPPSDILSVEGRQTLLKTLPTIKAIASVYLPGNCAYDQEFQVDEDGIIEIPRITSGSDLNDYMYLAAMSELNFHYVQSHFMHPDDVLDKDRGASLGWNTLKEKFTQYLTYIYGAASSIRNVTGSEMANAVKQYDYLSLDDVFSDKEIDITLGGFSGECYLMLRLNEGSVGSITGGTIEHLNGNLYLIHATEKNIKISKGE